MLFSRKLDFKTRGGPRLGLGDPCGRALAARWSREPEANHGWLIVATTNDGAAFYSSEHDSSHDRPRLVVEFVPPPDPEVDPFGLERSRLVETARED